MLLAFPSLSALSWHLSPHWLACAFTCSGVSKTHSAVRVVGLLASVSNSMSELQHPRKHGQLSVFFGSTWLPWRFDFARTNGSSSCRLHGSASRPEPSRTGQILDKAVIPIDSACIDIDLGVLLPTDKKTGCGARCSLARGFAAGLAEANGHQSSTHSFLLR